MTHFNIMSKKKKRNQTGSAIENVGKNSNLVLIHLNLKEEKT